MTGADDSRGSRLSVGNYETLDPEFLKAMNEIGHYGNEKYREESFFKNPTRSERKSTRAIVQHIQKHCEEFVAGVEHDHFHTLEHQLAAVAFNAMMEFYMFKREQAAKNAKS